MAHTPGPWVFRDGDHRNRAGYIYAGDKRIGYAYADKSRMFLGEAEANGNLMESAPDMYEALKAIEAQQLDTDGATCDWLQEEIAMVKAAIAKAEGKA